MRFLHWPLISILFCFSLFIPDSTRATNELAENKEGLKYILFVNQVRGEECCDQGRVETLNQQISIFESHQLPAAFAFRFDALTPKYLHPLKESNANHELAAFLEITPSLASSAQVAYQGDDSNWYRAQHSYLIGYTPEDRVKLVDAYMTRYVSEIGSYPKTTVAWMIDPISLKHLAEKYGVTAHEITREQWGTDSYTLHGGPPHYPYFPSANWALIPSDKESNMPVIFRQTVSDPLRNYGDFSSAFTSQPNDYLSGNNDFNYFKSLMAQTLEQPGNEYAIAILGLENSMHDEFQSEYFKQIEHIKELSLHDERIKIVTPTILRDLVSKNSSSILSGSDLLMNSNEKAWWITTNRYRLRLRYDGNNLFINDMRLYNESIPDPYFNEALSLPNGYWITPFLLDSSRINKEFAAKNQRPLSLLESIIELNPFSTPKNSGHYFEPGASSDLAKTSPALYLPKPDARDSFMINRDNSTITFSYHSQGEPLTAFFDKDSFQLPKLSKISSLTTPNLIGLDQSIDVIAIPPIKLQDKSLAWIDGKYSAFGMIIKYDADNNVFTPFFTESTSWDSLRKTYAYAFDPEAHAGSLNTDNTVIYAHNRQAIAGSNPVRFILQGYDDYNLPIAITNVSVDTQNDPEVSVQIHEPTQFNGGWWIDISSQSSGKKKVQVNFSDHTLSANAFFIEDCGAQLITCVKNPFQGVRFLQTKLTNRIKNLFQR